MWSQAETDGGRDGVVVAAAAVVVVAVAKTTVAAPVAAVCGGGGAARGQPSQPGAASVEMASMAPAPHRVSSFMLEMVLYLTTPPLPGSCIPNTTRCR